MVDETKKSKATRKQPDLREFMLKKIKSQGTFCSLSRDNETPLNVSESPLFQSSQSFTSFRSWNKPGRFEKHVGGVKSAHNLAYEKYMNLRDSKENSIVHVFDNASDMIRSEYETRLKASLTCLRFLLLQGLSFRGHNESVESISRGNFLELLKWLAKHNEGVKKVVFENAPSNHQLTSPKIQKDLINCCANETTRHIIQDLGDDYFSILADESSDVSQKEQLAICLRYVFIDDMQRDDKFRNLHDLGALSMMLVETKKHDTYPAIYLLIKLVLLLPAATAGVERVFSGMTYVKNRLRNSMGD